jgi:hypothetical protein
VSSNAPWKQYKILVLEKVNYYSGGKIGFVEANQDVESLNQRIFVKVRM